MPEGQNRALCQERFRPATIFDGKRQGFLNMAFFDFLKRRHKNPRQELLGLLEGYELPSFPVAVMRVLEMLRDPEAPLDKIAELVTADPGMHIMVLKTVNSAAFGLTKKISNVKHAITLLGKARLETLILPFAVKHSLPSSGYTCFDAGRFWLASARRGCMAGYLAEKINPSIRMESFTGGLLQDMAVPVISAVKESDYCTLIDQWNRDSSVNLKQLERDSIGFDHQAIGALMAEEWGFPDFLTRAILEHHEDIVPGDTLAPVKLASCLRYCQDVEEKELKDFMSGFIHEKTSLPEDVLVEVIDRAFDDASEFAAMFG